jgi:hypothetical protein
MLLALFLAPVLASGLPEISVKQTDDVYAAEAAPFSKMQVDAIEAEVARRAAQICFGKDVAWGKFRIDEELGKNPGTEPVKVKSYRREFRCVVAAQNSDAPAPANWAATAADDADVRRFFDDYYARRDAGETDAALAMFRPGVQEDAASWAVGVRDFNKQLGAGKRRLVAVTWYVNPEAADRPGIYAALDFVGDYPSMHFYCGYIGLYRRGAGSYEIVREEQNVFERNEETPDAQQLATMRAGFCRGN